jgi:hypothetical protein
VNEICKNSSGRLIEEESSGSSAASYAPSSSASAGGSSSFDPYRDLHAASAVPGLSSKYNND